MDDPANYINVVELDCRLPTAFDSASTELVDTSSMSRATRRLHSWTPTPVRVDVGGSVGGLSASVNGMVWPQQMHIKLRLPKGWMLFP